MRAESVAEDFYAGRYARVVERTVDAPSFDTAHDVAFVVGALAFVGRLEEARLVFASHRWAREDAREALRARVAARFFLGVAFGRAGRHGESERAFLENLREGRGADDPATRFYVAQGLACFRYFRGLVARAARHARRALQHAFVARFQYGRLLATDLRGHALIQLGRISQGLVLLEQAREIARALGFAGNAAAIDCAVGVYRAHFGVVPLARAIEELSALSCSSATEDSYSRHSVRLELAHQLALGGRSDEAWAVLAELAGPSAPGGDRRARVRFLLACALVAQLRHGIPSARTYVAEARDMLEAVRDYALDVEVLAAELAVADEEDRAPLLAELKELHVRTGLSRAGVYADVFGADAATEAEALRTAQFEEDRAGARLLRVFAANADDVGRLLHEGYLGLVPLACGVLADAAIVEVSQGRLVVAERGNVRVVNEVPAGAVRLLRALAADERGARAPKDKESLLRGVWGIAHYNPERHDSVLHTAVSRLRAVLGTSGHWVEGLDGAYRLAPFVVVAAPRRGDFAVVTPPPLAEPEPPAREEALLALLRGKRLSTTELATALRVSEMTAFRALRGLLAAGSVVRSGRGRSTRYGAATAAEGGGS